MSDLRGKSRKMIHLDTHGENYGSWMSNPVFYMAGGLMRKEDKDIHGGSDRKPEGRISIFSGYSGHDSAGNL